jgi:hypothetical protein
MAQLPSQSSLICAVARGQLCLWPRVRSATAGLSEAAQRGGGPCYEFRSPGQALCTSP